MLGLHKFLCTSTLSAVPNRTELYTPANGYVSTLKQYSFDLSRLDLTFSFCISSPHLFVVRFQFISISLKNYKFTLGIKTITFASVQSSLIKYSAQINTTFWAMQTLLSLPRQANHLAAVKCVFNFSHHKITLHIWAMEEHFLVYLPSSVHKVLRIHDKVKAP